MSTVLQTASQVEASVDVDSTEAGNLMCGSDAVYLVIFFNKILTAIQSSYLLLITIICKFYFVF